MITLYQPAPMFGLIGVSPFCMKLEAFLRLHGIEFTIKEGLPHQGPYKKIPFVEYQNRRLGDSSAIINQLLKDYQIDYSHAEHLCIGPAWQRLVEEHLYWALVYFRWMDDAAWPKLKKAFFGAVPGVIRSLVETIARRQVKSALYHQGIGRLPEPMILQRADEDLKALSDWLAVQPYICGAQLTHFDLAVWSMLSQILDCELKIQLTPVAEKYLPLRQYLDRVNSDISPVLAAEEPALAV